MDKREALTAMTMIECDDYVLLQPTFGKVCAHDTSGMLPVSVLQGQAAERGALCAQVCWEGI